MGGLRPDDIERSDWKRLWWRGGFPSSNTSKRLVKRPKIYLRDSGLFHALLAIDSMEQLMGTTG